VGKRLFESDRRKRSCEPSNLYCSDHEIKNIYGHFTSIDKLLISIQWRKLPHSEYLQLLKIIFSLISHIKGNVRVFSEHIHFMIQIQALYHSDMSIGIMSILSIVCERGASSMPYLEN